MPRRRPADSVDRGQVHLAGQRIVLDRLMNMALNVGGKSRIDLGQNSFAVPQRPHLADGLVANPRDHPADVPHDGVHGLALGRGVDVGVVAADRFEFMAMMSWATTSLTPAFLSRLVAVWRSE